ncbi:MAG TPA: 30S ribosomal protein S3 [Candidatus Diapherotrites archaeon]|uniref:30S ribosomal protein S3 n=1 Tax=Candidatus Iainarchaeum sp. TaxID=3101447 RepID=A0A7J4IXI9_9ARCH|nr:30S ribosomal protein S3 [Candidatus Diapherotrites archaeon]
MIERFFVKQGLNKVELDNYLAKELDKAGFTKSEIVKTPLVTRIVVSVTRPGLAIGKSGSNITQLTETIGRKFGIDNPQLEIKEIERPELDAKAVANKFKALIERGFSWRSVVFKGLNDILHAGAQGAEIVVSGKLAGKGGRKKRVRVGSGYMKKVGEQAKLVDYGYASAYPKVGAIGIKVKIVRPETVFPDKERIQPYIKRKEEAAEKARPAQEAAAQAAAATNQEAGTQQALEASDAKPQRAEKEEPKQEHKAAEKAQAEKGHEKAHREHKKKDKKEKGNPGQKAAGAAENAPVQESGVAEIAKEAGEKEQEGIGPKEGI